MRIPRVIRILKCQANGCNKRADHFYLNVSGWFCEEHYRANEEDTRKIIDWVEKQDEYTNGQ